MVPPPAELPTSGWRLWWLGARPRTLPAAIAPVLVGTAAATVERPGVIWWRLVCALGVALSVQIATNFANDYSDGKRGTDDPSQRVGPPRLVGNGLAPAAAVKRATLISFLVTGLFGLPLVIWVDWRLVLVGVAAIAAGWFYTGGSRPYGYAGFGELFVFVFFGLVAVVFSTFVQIERLTWLSVACGVAIGCLATALLVVNNLRDISGDAAAGKRTLAVRLGDRGTRFLYVALIVIAMVLVPVIAGFGGRPVAGLALVSVFAARRPVVDVLGGAYGAALLRVLADTGRVELLYAVVLAIGLVIAP